MICPFCRNGGCRRKLTNEVGITRAVICRNHDSSKHHVTAVLYASKVPIGSTSSPGDEQSPASQQLLSKPLSSLKNEMPQRN